MVRVRGICIIHPAESLSGTERQAGGEQSANLARPSPSPPLSLSVVVVVVVVVVDIVVVSVAVTPAAVVVVIVVVVLLTYSAGTADHREACTAGR